MAEKAGFEMCDCADTGTVSSDTADKPRAIAHKALNSHEFVTSTKAAVVEKPAVK